MEVLKHVSTHLFYKLYIRLAPFPVQNQIFGFVKTYGSQILDKKGFLSDCQSLNSITICSAVFVAGRRKTHWVSVFVFIIKIGM